MLRHRAGSRSLMRLLSQRTFTWHSAITNLTVLETVSDAHDRPGDDGIRNDEIELRADFCEPRVRSIGQESFIDKDRNSARFQLARDRAMLGRGEANLPTLFA